MATVCALKRTSYASAALRVAHIDAKTADPFGGKIVKDARTGEPTGMLLDAAQSLVQRHLPALTPAEAEIHLLIGVAREIALGWTQIHIAGNSWSEVEQLRALYRAGKIKLRIYDAIRGPGPDADRLLRQGPSVGEFGDRFTVRAIKIWLDGRVPGAGGRAISSSQSGSSVCAKILAISKGAENVGRAKPAEYAGGFRHRRVSHHSTPGPSLDGVGQSIRASSLPEP